MSNKTINVRSKSWTHSIFKLHSVSYSLLFLRNNQKGVDKREQPRLATYVTAILNPTHHHW